jgi:hypothetical protein
MEVSTSSDLCVWLLALTTDATVNWNTDDPVTPLKESDGRSVNDWFAHGRKAYPPKAGDFMVLPAGGSYSGMSYASLSLSFTSTKCSGSDLQARSHVTGL